MTVSRTGFAIRPCLLPEPERDWKRIDAEATPPCSLVTRTMQLGWVRQTGTIFAGRMRKDGVRSGDLQRQRQSFEAGQETTLQRQRGPHRCGSCLGQAGSAAR